MRRLVPLLALALLALPAPASAGDPIMPLSEVRSGMQCTGLSVVRGTEISSFDVEIVDVVTGAPRGSGARILVRVSGPAVDSTGLGPGFSGSPILCRDEAGTMRNAGAISESVGEYGNRLALATPIEEILGVPVDPPTGARHDPAVAASGRPLTAPLTVAGAHPALARLLSAAGRRAGVPVLTTPGGPRAGYPPQPMRPGAAAAAALTSGDLALSAVGTVAYEDAGRVWLFGHGLDGTGARSLLMQDAYVFTVVSNPGAGEEGSTYKLAAPGNVVGTITSDAPAAVAGTAGAPPRTFPVRVVAEDLDRDRVEVTELDVADETPLAHPSGFSTLSLALPFALEQGAASALNGLPPRLTGRMCLRIELRGREDPIRFCNRYVSSSAFGGFGNGVAPLALDASRAVEILEGFQFGPIEIERVEANIELRRGARQAYIRRVSAPRRVRRGSRVPVRVVARMVDGPLRTFRFRVRVPRDVPRGLVQLRLAGRGPDFGSDDIIIEIIELLDEGGEGDEEEDDGSAGDPGLPDLDAVEREIESIERYDGVRAVWARPSGRRLAADGTAFRHPTVRLGGRASVTVRVVR